MNTPISIDAAARSHVGLVRRRNEDSFYCGQRLFAVADGLGGHVGGDVASATAINAMKPYDRPTRAADLTTVLGRAISAADQALRQRIRQRPEVAGMGTTVVAVLQSDNAAALANVGDSRGYLMSDTGIDGRVLMQVTEDHTYQHLVSDAATVPDLAERLTRFLDGRKDGRSPDLVTLPLRPGDRILLCSDGLSSYVRPEVIQAALNSLDDPAETADRLITSALEVGGPDNVTVIVLDVRGAPDAVPRPGRGDPSPD